MNAALSGPPAGPRVIVGIDLGTSQTALAFAECRPDAEVSSLSVPQWVPGRRRDARLLLPSVAYAPLPGELPGIDGGPGQWVIGEYARARSHETIGRAIESAKSWLCHAGVERLAKILPWGTDALPEDQKLSPVDVSRRILAEVIAAFEALHPEQPLSQAQVIITVPASFDQTARMLTVMASEQAGLRARLLEEPQAAFYEYLAEQRDELDALVAERGRVRVLVCDVGGGTTDLSLIDVAGSPGALELRRSAVGRHLLLGGDNMDLAVARLAEQALGAEPLDPGQRGQLRTAARAAKEALLAADAPSSFPVRLVGAGAELFADRRAVDLGRDEVRKVLLDGFFPRTAAGQLPDARRAGFTTLGLPFERDPAVTRHLAQFLARHAEGRVPDALLVNGGVMRSALVRDRLRECLEGWGEGPIAMLSAPDPELAVCRGAVRYGLATAGLGARIEGGAAQGYYVAVDSADRGGPREGLCVVPRGAREGERHVLGGRRFELLMGRPARFELYAHDSASHPPGARVALGADYQPLPALATVPELAGVPTDTRVEVQLEGELSAIGTVELESVLLASGSAEQEQAPRFRLAFELGARERAASEPPRSLPRPRPGGVDRQRWSAAEEALDRVFGKGRKDIGPREAKDLVRTLERVLGGRKEWDLEVSRRTVDVLLDNIKARVRSEDHERAFWMLVGFCARPGFGHPLDAQRIQRLWPAFEPGLTHKEAERGWQQYWIAWRRVAGGLLEPMQARVRDVADPFLAPPELKLKKPKGLRPAAGEELLELASHLERLPPVRRAALGGWLIERTWSDRDPRLWTHIGRIGARVPAYASAHHVVSASVVERWVEQLLRERWSEVSTAAASALSLCRVTGDETRDLAPRLRQEAARAMERAGAPDEWRRAVLEHVPVSEAEREARFGDDLPLGLRLIE